MGRIAQEFGVGISWVRGTKASPILGVTPAQAGAHPAIVDCTARSTDNTTTLRLALHLGLGPGLRRGDTVGGEALCYSKAMGGVT
ncbi:MAG: hypothetical protein JWP26_4224 [Devosia sp.]|nr:hypothetical protein [Devosia sp.]